MPLGYTYKSSIYWPILVGELAWQRRFFDVIAHGCLPFVMVWQTPQLPGGKSWFLPDNFPRYSSYSVEQSYPFYRRERDYPANPYKVEYESFVVECPGYSQDHRNMSNAKSCMEQLMLDQTALKKKQLAMKKWSISFRYGVGTDAHQYEDSFALIIRSLREYLDKYVCI